MQEKMTTAIVENLLTAEILIDKLTPQQFTDTTIGPYYSSIGGHLRHILDVFACAFDGLESGQINLITRERNELVETIQAKAHDYLMDIVSILKSAKDLDENRMLNVTDDLGCGPVTLKYTLSGLMAQAHSHAIHHFACIGYILEQMNVVLPEKRFGYNPTTPEKV